VWKKTGEKKQIASSTKEPSPLRSRFTERLWRDARTEYAYRRQHKCNDQSECIWRVSLPARMVVSVENAFEFYDCRTTAPSFHGARKPERCEHDSRRTEYITSILTPGMLLPAFGLSENECSDFCAVGAPVLMAPSRLLGRSEGRCGTNPPGQGRDYSDRDSG
jgi:hypothetical protein